jgi:hypothetical protein
MPESFIFICMSLGELRNACEDEEMDERTREILEYAWDQAPRFSIEERGQVEILMKKLHERQGDK